MMTTPHLQAEGEGCRVERNFGFGGIGGTCLVAKRVRRTSSLVDEVNAIPIIAKSTFGRNI
eukprot:scaffold21368_cov105-Skeletonema_menzelii.AAC.1